MSTSKKKSSTNVARGSNSRTTKAASRSSTTSPRAQSPSNAARSLAEKSGAVKPAGAKATTAKPAAAKTTTIAALAGTGIWLMKSEPESFSFDDLWRAKGRRTGWDGVRNYQARNFLRDTMRVGDLVLVYHSNAEPSGVAGIARVSAPARPDPTQFDPNDEHFDAQSERADPTWFEVEVEALARFPRFVGLEVLKNDPRLPRMLVVQRGQRLSVQPVQPGEWRVVLALGGLDPDEFPLPSPA